MEIGWFQLENLFLSRNLFYSIFDLRSQPRTLGLAHLDPILEQAVKIAGKDVGAYLEKENLPKIHPIILLCENGRGSAKTARQLEALGFTQVYVLEDGEVGLLSE